MIKLINNKVAVGRLANRCFVQKTHHSKNAWIGICKAKAIKCATFFYPSQSLQCNPNLFVGESLTFCLLHFLCLLANDITFAAMPKHLAVTTSFCKGRQESQGTFNI